MDVKFTPVQLLSVELFFFFLGGGGGEGGGAGLKFLRIHILGKSVLL